MSQIKDDQVRGAVRERYAEIATLQGGSCCGGGASCCSPADMAATSAHLGYSQEELEAVPEGSNLGLGCGNPQAIAALKPGETVLDLGSGAGFDCFLAAKQVGAAGKVIGVDMTPDMLSRARQCRAGRLCQHEFRLGGSSTAGGRRQCGRHLSNCVINLSPDKVGLPRAHRVLKPGGRLAISDVVALGPIQEALRRPGRLYRLCVGAAPVADLEQWLRQAGFNQVRIDVKSGSRDYIRTGSPALKEIIASATLEGRQVR